MKTNFFAPQPNSPIGLLPRTKADDSEQRVDEDDSEQKVQ